MRVGSSSSRIPSKDSAATGEVSGLLVPRLQSKLVEVAFQERRVGTLQRSGTAWQSPQFLALVFFLQAPLLSETYYANGLEWSFAGISFGVAAISALYSLLVVWRCRLACFFDLVLWVVGTIGLILAGFIRPHLARILDEETRLQDGLDDSWHVFGHILAALAACAAQSGAMLAVQQRCGFLLTMLHLGIMINTIAMVVNIIRHRDEDIPAAPEVGAEVQSWILLNALMFVIGMLINIQRAREAFRDRREFANEQLQIVNMLSEATDNQKVQSLRRERAMEGGVMDTLFAGPGANLRNLLQSQTRSIDIYEELEDVRTATLRVGDRVLILKEGTYKGKSAIVTDPFWNGLVKVEIEELGGRERTKSYLRSNLGLKQRNQALRVFRLGDHVRVKKPSRMKDMTAVVVRADWHGLVKVLMDDKAHGAMKSYRPDELEQVASRQESGQLSPTRGSNTTKLPELKRKALTVPMPMKVKPPAVKEEGLPAEADHKKAPTGSSPPPGMELPAPHEAAVADNDDAPNAVLRQGMHRAHADWACIRLMAERIMDEDYSLRNFFDDCIASFPELNLFFAKGATGCSSGTSGEVEYQRTIGALFAVYWLIRIPSDGRNGFSMGVDDNWLPIRLEVPAREARAGRASFSSLASTLAPGAVTAIRSMGGLASPTGEGSPPVFSRSGTVLSLASRSAVLTGSGSTSVASSTKTPTLFRVDDYESIVRKPWSELSEFEKRVSFCMTTDWSVFSDLIVQAGCCTNHGESKDVERIMALLCLTAIHDIMKMEVLLPIVQEGHGPYKGYEEGVRISDHDIALSYVMEHFPELLPSFSGLPEKHRRSVLFTQGKLQFNHGWFVQAEAPPGKMLAAFKEAVQDGTSAQDISLYFLHWLTDLAGAEGTPLGGAEKFVLKFPRAVLASFLWSIPYLEQLALYSETEVVQSYLEARWTTASPTVSIPEGSTAIAVMRLAVMAQDPGVVDVFSKLPASDQNFLAREMARTGKGEQSFDRVPPVRGGPALLVYYGPALLQRNVGKESDLFTAVVALCRVMQGARYLWPTRLDQQGETVTITVAELKTRDIATVVGGEGGDTRGMWVLVRHNDCEGTVMLSRAKDLNRLHNEGARFCALDFSPGCGREYLERAFCRL